MGYRTLVRLGVCCAGTALWLWWAPGAPAEGPAGVRSEVAAAASAEGLSPRDAVAAMALPEGFQVDLIAAEPDVRQPIALAIDDRGRLWVAESLSYPQRLRDADGMDRVLILEDGDGDGSFETRKVFLEGLNLVSGLEVGFGGVWVGAAPYFFYVPDKDGDDVPDRGPVVLLDGWGHENARHALNSFIWGPDGWLYGCHGALTHSNAGKPGAPDAERQKLNAGVWRYHPSKHEFEVFAHGMSSPSGVDFNDHGQAFASASAIPHLYHVIHGGRYRRQSGLHFNPHTYEDLASIADHLHFGGIPPETEPVDPQPSTDQVGGGLAHCGLSVYLGDQFPPAYRNALLSNNIYENRISRDDLVRNGSGFTAIHGQDLLRSSDPWHMGVALRYGPDGSLFLTDWYERQKSHDRDAGAWDRSNGRIYRVRYGDLKPGEVNLAAASDAELIAMQLESNDWLVRTARRLLQERADAGELSTNAVRWKLRSMFRNSEDVTRRLRAFWCLHVIGALSDHELRGTLPDPEEYVRAWAIQVLGESPEIPTETLEILEQMAGSDASPVVRLSLACLLQRLPLEQRWKIAENLAGRSEDDVDPNIPTVLWFGIEPLVEADPARALAIAAGTPISRVRRCIYRRASAFAQGRDALIRSLLDEPMLYIRVAMLSGMVAALDKSGRIPAPPSWDEAYETLFAEGGGAMGEDLLMLAARFGDERAFPYFRDLLRQDDVPREERETAIEILADGGDELVVPFLQRMAARSGELRIPIIRGLARFTDPKTPAALLAVYPNLFPDEKREAVSVLITNPAYARELVSAVDSGRVEKEDVSPFGLRQIAQFADKALLQAMEKHWGAGAAPGDGAAQPARNLQDYESILAQDNLAPGDPAQGRVFFDQRCSSCHRLFDHGAAVGPDLTASDRANAESVLKLLLRPNAAVDDAYRLHVVTTRDGRVFSGLLRGETDESIRLVLAGGLEIVLEASQVAKHEVLPESVKPEGLLNGLSAGQLRDLMAYLASPEQVPYLDGR